jgi:BirA family biotin operon repressor/biotin-[acetyl-CoA-carboxylase] ligase
MQPQERKMEAWKDGSTEAASPLPTFHPSNFPSSNLPSFRTHVIGRRTHWFERVDSTNTVAAGFSADEANDGLVIVAEEQSAGRGRQGRTWLSPPGEGLLLSVLLFPPEHLRRPAVLTGLAAVAVCETIHHCTRLQATIKWPNDVLVEGKKVCGILVEQVVLEGRGLVIGLGLNVNTPAAVFAEAGLPHAASLAMFAQRNLDRAEVLAVLLRQLDSHYHDVRQGRLDDLESRWRWHTGLLGKEVVVHVQSQPHEGRLVELAFNGAVLETNDGRYEHFMPEMVEHILAGASG